MNAFAYSVSHDLRVPLRHIDGFLELLQYKAGAALNEQSRHCDLLSFSRMGRHAMSFQPLTRGPLVREVIRELAPNTAGKDIEWPISDLPAVSGDASMLRIVLDNPISNALK